MANVEQGKVAPVFSASATLGAGLQTIATADSRPINGSTVIQSIVRTTVAGAPGVPSARLDPPTAAGNAWSIKLTSSNAGDSSIYSVYWVNDYQASPLYVQGVAGTAAPCQFAP